MLKLHPVEFDNAELTMSPIDLTWQEQGDLYIHSSTDVVTDLSGPVVTAPQELGWHDALRPTNNAVELPLYTMRSLGYSPKAARNGSVSTFVRGATAAHVCSLIIHQSTRCNKRFITKVRECHSPSPSIGQRITVGHLRC